MKGEEGHTGGNQPVLMPTPVSPAAVAPLVENIVEKYGDLKRTVHDFLVTLDPADPIWKNSFLPTLAELVGLIEPYDVTAGDE